MNLIIIIPAYNEEKSIVNVINQIRKLEVNKKIVIVDDASIDRTSEIVKNSFEKVILLKHRINLGKGAALKTGCEAIFKLGISGDVVVFIDADGQHCPDDILRLTKKLEKEQLDIVFGVRKIDKEKMPLLKYLANKFLTLIICFFSKVYLKDTQTGFKAFIPRIYPKIAWQAQDYSVETEIILNVGRNKLKYGQVLIETIYIDNYKGTSFFDGVKIFINFFKQKFL